MEKSFVTKYYTIVWNLDQLLYPLVLDQEGVTNANENVFYFLTSFSDAIARRSAIFLKSFSSITKYSGFPLANR